MSISNNNLRINHDLTNEYFYIKVKGGTAELRYERHGDAYLELVSTTVPSDSQDFGIGGLLVEKALKYAEREELKVKPSCIFAQKFVQEHSEYNYLLN